MAKTEKVTLKRAYLWVPEGERTAVSYGPGEVEIPKAMADGLRRANVLEPADDAPASTPAPARTQAAPEPARASAQGVAWIAEAGYDAKNVENSIAYIETLSDTERAIVLAHEKRTRNRSTVLKAFGIG